MGNSSVLKLIRLVRLTRMARMARLLRAMPELLILIKGIGVASRSVAFTLLLLIVIMYFYAIVLRQLVGQLMSSDGPDLIEIYFPSVPDAMMSLLLDGVLPDQAQIVRDLSFHSPILAAIVLSFIMLASLTVMNMLVGVLCEVVSVVSAVEKEQLTVGYVKSQLLTCLEELGVDRESEEQGDLDDGDVKLAGVTKTEFQKLLIHPAAAQIIQEIGVDVVGLVDMADYIFKDDQELSFTEFIDLILRLRGTNHCTVKDIMEMRKHVMKEVGLIQEGVRNNTEAMSKILRNSELTDQWWVAHSTVSQDTVSNVSGPVPLLSYSCVTPIASSG